MHAIIKTEIETLGALLIGMMIMAALATAAAAILGGLLTLLLPPLAVLTVMARGAQPHQARQWG